MSKVVTSEGLQDFISTGKPTEVIAKKAALDAKLAVADSPEPEKPVIEANAEKPADEIKLVEKEDNGLEPEDNDLAERAKKRIGKKHYEMKKAQEEAAKAREEAEQDAKLAENLFNERELYRKRAEEAEKALEAAKAAPKPAEVPIAEPVETDAKYWNDKKEFQLRAFLKDHDEWRDADARQKAEADRRREQEAAIKAENEKVDVAFKSKVETARATKYPDWDEKVAKADVVLPFAVLDYIKRSDYGDDLAYFLATHKEVADSIRAMHFTRGIAELANIETSFKKPATPAATEKTEVPATTPATSKTVERQGAPAPITPIPTGGSPVQVDPAKMDFKQLRAYERSRAQEARRR